MRVAVTGATGFVGGVLVRRLIDEGHEVRCLVRGDAAELEGLDVQVLRGDVCDPDSLTGLMMGADRSFHCAAMISIDGDHGGMVERVNVDGARNVAEAALVAGVDRHVHVSSCHAYDLMKPGTVDETADRPGPGYPSYDRSKAAGEAAVREVVAAGLHASIVNPCGVVGPLDKRPSRIGKILVDLANRTLPALTPGGFTWVDVRDVVDGILRAADSGGAGDGYLLGGEYATLTRFAQLACDEVGVKPPWFTSPMWLARATAPAATWYAHLTKTEPLYTSEALHAVRSPCRISSDKAKRELGWAPRPLAETIVDSLAWFREDGQIQ